MTTIQINDLKLQAIVGTLKEERDQKQDIVINVSFDYDASEAVETDNLEKAIDYDVLVQDITKHIKKSKYFLLEKLTKAVLNIVMAKAAVKRATISIDKLNAIKSAKSVSVHMNAQK